MDILKKDTVIDLINRFIFIEVKEKEDELTGKKRSKEIANARHVTIYLIRKITEMSFPNIGKIFNRDHATIISSFDKIQKKVHADPVFNIEIMELSRDLQGKVI